MNLLICERSCSRGSINNIKINKMYIVKLNNKEVLKNDIITLCVNTCLSYIGDSFKEFNKKNNIQIYKDDKSVWNSNLATN